MTKDEVKALRAKLELSQAQFAAQLGVSIRSVQSWEQGVKRPGSAARELLRRVEAEANGHASKK